MRKLSPISRLSAALLALALPLAPMTAQAVVDDALSYAMEAATPFVSQGFKVRTDHWDGEILPGGQKAVKHQLFKGNEYCFWVASAIEGVALTIKVYLPDGTPAAVTEITDSTNAKSVRLPATVTGSYIIVFSLSSATLPKDEPISWALAYGYR